MRSRGWRAPRASAEEARRRLRELGLLRSDLRVAHLEGAVVFPVVSTPPAGAVAGDEVETDFEPFGAHRPAQYSELVELPEALRSELPRSFDVVGDIVLIRLPESLTSYGEEIGRALLAFVPGARVVGRDDGVHGAARRRRIVRLAGDGGWATRHKENGLSLDVDLERAYFSPRLSREHERVARAVGPGERVLDLCCGVGPFALTIAHRGLAREVVAVDANPDAVALLRTNLRRLGLEERVRVVEDDVGRFLPRAGLARQAILNLPHEGIKYVPSVGNAVEPSGTLHYYEVTERSAAESRPAELIAQLPGPSNWSLRERHVVHAYSPRADLVYYALAREAP